MIVMVGSGGDGVQQVDDVERFGDDRHPKTLARASEEPSERVGSVESRTQDEGPPRGRWPSCKNPFPEDQVVGAEEAGVEHDLGDIRMREDVPQCVSPGPRLGDAVAGVLHRGAEGITDAIFCVDDDDAC
jgi:hypothetical protein